MLRSFDFLGWLKWPSLLSVTAVPVVSFAFWGGFDDAVPVRSYGSVQAGRLSVDLRHPAASEPRHGKTLWCARPCPDCGPRIARVEIAYGGMVAPRGEWTALTQDALDLCAELSKAPASSDRIWIRLVPHDGAPFLSSRPLSTPSAG